MEQVIRNPQPQSQPREPLVKKISAGTLKNFDKRKILMVVLAVLVVLAGIGVGMKLSGYSFSGGNNDVAPGAKKTANEAGMDVKDCKDEVEGNLEEGGIEGEGTHHLVRSADKSKDVYMGSTVIDLESFVGKKVKVTGQTISGKKAGWLMDVCKIKVIE